MTEYIKSVVKNFGTVERYFLLIWLAGSTWKFLKLSFVLKKFSYYFCENRQETTMCSYWTMVRFLWIRNENKKAFNSYFCNKLKKIQFSVETKLSLETATRTEMIICATSWRKNNFKVQGKICNRGEAVFQNQGKYGKIN